MKSKLKRYNLLNLESLFSSDIQEKKKSVICQNKYFEIGF